MSNALSCATSLSPVANLADYLRAVFSFQPLGADEERELARRLRETGDTDAAWRLVTSNLRYVVFIARGYLGYGISQEELIQEGNVGLMEAVKRFDPDQGVPLRAYAAYSIRYHIHEFIIRNWRMVKVATTKARRRLFFKLRSTKRRLAWLNHQEAADIAAQLDADPDDVTRMEAAMYLADVSLDARDDDESEPRGEPPVLGDGAANPESIAEAQEFQRKCRAAVDRGMSTLDARSRRILEARWLGDDKLTLQALAKEFGVSIERVRQLEAAAIRRLRGEVERLLTPCPAPPLP